MKCVVIGPWKNVQHAVNCPRLLIVLSDCLRPVIIFPFDDDKKPMIQLRGKYCKIFS
jgi:hypothetical protein